MGREPRVGTDPSRARHLRDPLTKNVPDLHDRIIIRHERRRDQDEVPALAIDDTRSRVHENAPLPAGSRDTLRDLGFARERLPRAALRKLDSPERPDTTHAEHGS